MAGRQVFSIAATVLRVIMHAVLCAMRAQLIGSKGSEAQPGF
jgi:hypothetical protein